MFEWRSVKESLSYISLIVGEELKVESGKLKVVYEEFRVPSLRENWDFQFIVRQKNENFRGNPEIIQLDYFVTNVPRNDVALDYKINVTFNFQLSIFNFKSLQIHLFIIQFTFR